MKLIFVIGIFAVLCIQISHQIPFGKKDRKIPFPIPDKNFVDGVKTFDFQVKNHGVRDVGQDIPGIGDGVIVDTDNVAGDKVLSKRGGLFKKVINKIEEKVKDPTNYIPFLVKRDVDEPQIGKNDEEPIISKTSNFDLGTGVHVDQVFVDSDFEKEKEIQIVKRGWFKKLWKKIKNVVVESLLGMFKRTSNDIPNHERLEIKNDFKEIEVVLSDDIIEVDLGNDFKNEEEKEKAIQKVKRGWFKKIRKKIVKVLTGAVVGSVVGGVVKRGSGNEIEVNVVEDAPKVDDLPLLLKTLRLRPGTADQIAEIVQKLGGDLNGHDPQIFKIPVEEIDPENVKPKGHTLPLLLKTLRLRPGTADQITEIVQKLGGDTEFQDEMIDEILNDNDVEDGVVQNDDDNVVLDRNAKNVFLDIPKCKFVGWRLKCTRN